MKTSELTGPALDWAAAKCEGVLFPRSVPKYSTDWARGGPIIEREQIAMWPEAHEGAIGTETSTLWFARIYYSGGEQYDLEQPAASPLIAAMRCYVASKLGDEVEIPKELT